MRATPAKMYKQKRFSEVNILVSAKCDEVVQLYSCVHKEKIEVLFIEKNNLK